MCGLLTKQFLRYLGARHLLTCSETCGHSSLPQGCQGSSLMMIVSSPRPEAANEFYDGDHDNDKESDVEI